MSVFGARVGMRVGPNWLTALRRYIGFAAVAHLLWQLAHLPLMVVIPLIDAGLSPVLQWIAIPLAAWWWAVLPTRREPSERTRHA